MSNQIFTGFTFNNIHSSTYNILRVSGGDRYEILASPLQEDTVVEMKGVDGEYFFTARYGSREFTLQLAFDNLSEENLQKTIYWLSTKQVHNLIFDEWPYKEYQVKITDPLKLKVVPFEENNTRIYKGEGEITFTAFYPYARAPYQTLTEYQTQGIPIADWKESSRILNSKKYIIQQEPLITNHYDTIGGNFQIVLRNCGHFPSPLIIPHIVVNQIATGPQFIKYQINSEVVSQLVLDLDRIKSHIGVSNYSGFKIDSKTKLITGVEREGNIWKSTGKIYNDIILAGDFIYIYPQEDEEIHELIISPENTGGITIVPFTIGSNQFDVKYDYLYL